MTKPTITIIKRIPEKNRPYAGTDAYWLNKIYNQFIDELEVMEIDVEKLARFLHRQIDLFVGIELDRWDTEDDQVKLNYIEQAQSIKTAIEDGAILKEVED